MTISSGLRDRPKVFRLSVRTQDRGGAVASAVKDPGNLGASGCRHLLILIHGFNNTEGDADDSYEEQIGMLTSALQDSKIAPDAIVKFFWPGDLAVSPLRLSALDAAGYPFDIDQARASAALLANYLANFPGAGAPGSLKISLICHSLGCRLFLEALHHAALANGPNFEVISLLAAAVPVELTRSGALLEPHLGRSRRLLKFFSENDLVLQLAFPAGQAAAVPAGTESAVYIEAIGRFGNPGSLGEANRTNNHHNQYWGDQEVALSFLAAVDPVLRTTIAGNKLMERQLPPASPISLRNLLIRSLPF